MPSEREEPPAEPTPGCEATTEDAAAFLVAKMVRNAADATAEWLQDSATAFETSIKTAVKGGYSTDQLAKDAAKMWKRNLTLAARLLVASQPSTKPDEEPATGEPSRGT
jgi:hypothetical protein